MTSAVLNFMEYFLSTPAVKIVLKFIDSTNVLVGLSIGVVLAPLKSKTSLFNLDIDFQL